MVEERELKWSGRGGVEGKGKIPHEVRDREVTGWGCQNFWGRFRFRNTHFSAPAPPSPSGVRTSAPGSRHPAERLFFK
jgi:hypothetical protein